MRCVWEILPKLTATVRADHIERDMLAAGHSFDHTLQVGQVALLIAESEPVQFLASAAGLCHNADRLLQHERRVGKENIPEADIIATVRAWLEASGEIPVSEWARIIRAVLRHSGPNLDDGDEVLVALQDADRVVCSMAEAPMTSTQFWSELPVIDPRCLVGDPTAHPYRDPKSVLNGLTCRDDWVNPGSKVCVRLARARVMMERRVNFIQNYIREVAEQRAEIGLWPEYPF